MMGVDDVQSDLIGLRKLYGLLNIKEEEGALLLNSISQILDDTARIFLKKLLDAAAVKVFEASFKIMAADRNVSITAWLREQMKSIQKLQGISASFPTATQHSRKNLNLPSAVKPIFGDSVSEMSLCSTNKTRPFMNREGNWVNEESSLKHLNSAEGMKIHGDRKHCSVSKRCPVNQRCSDQYSHFNSVSGLVEESDLVSRRCEEKQVPDKKESCPRNYKLADNRVNPVKEKKMEQAHLLSRTSSLRLADSLGPSEQTKLGMLKEGMDEHSGDKRLDWLRKNGNKLPETPNQPLIAKSDPHSRRHCQKCGRTKTSFLGVQPLSQIPTFHKEASITPSQKLAQISGQNTTGQNTTVRLDGAQSMRQSVTRDLLNSGTSCNVIKGLRISPRQIDKKDVEGCVVNVPSKRTKVMRLQKDLQGKKAHGETLRSNRREQVIMPSVSRKDSKAQESSGSYRTLQFDRSSQESITSWSSEVSSDWTSQQTSMCSEGTEEYSPSDQEYSSGIVESESNINSDSYALSSDGTSSSSREREGYSLSSHMGSQLVVSSLRRNHHGTVRNKPSPNKANEPETGVGRLKKFKNKVALIFHHHHHHHHQHGSNDASNDASSDSGDNDEMDGECFTSMPKAFHGKGKYEKHGERAVEKWSKSKVRRAPHRGQQGQLESVVGGLVKHVMNSTEFRQPKEGIGWIGRSRFAQHGHDNMVKKLHWWQKYGKQQKMKLGVKKGRNPVLGAMKMKRGTLQFFRR